MIPVWKYEDKHEADAEWISVVYFLVLNLLLCSSSILCIKHTIVVVYGTFVWIMRESLALSLWSEALPCTSIGVWGAPRFIPQSGRNCLTLFSRFPEQFHALHSMSFFFSFTSNNPVEYTKYACDSWIMKSSNFTKYRLDIVPSIFLSAFLGFESFIRECYYIYLYMLSTDYKDTIKYISIFIK